MMDSPQTSYVLQALSQFEGQLRDVLRGMPPEMLVWQPTSTDWSVQMVLAHLLHCEPHFQARLACIMRTYNPFLHAFGPTDAPPYSTVDTTGLLATFATVRRQTLRQIYTYRPGDWSRPAVHENVGRTSLYEQIQIIFHHDLEHLGQLHDLCALWTVTPIHERHISN